jgi:uncharacterized OsmC-like protein
VVDRASSATLSEGDPYHAALRVGTKARSRMQVGVHGAVGGPHDLPVPGDILCAALASCLDSTLRLLADRMGVALRRLEVDVAAEVGVRGTLAVDAGVPVGFQRMQCRVALNTAPGTPAAAAEQLLAAAERYCVVLQTLRAGVRVDARLEERS